MTRIEIPTGILWFLSRLSQQNIRSARRIE